MLKSIFSHWKESESHGLDLPAGSNHYRAYVGPPRDYDLVSAMVFNLLTSVGVRQNHKLIDIGCGSLRLGRLFIPYLNQGCYFGVEPNKWLVDKGIKNEVGKSQIKIKKPRFIYSGSLSELGDYIGADFAVAQSIFSHCGLDLIDGWLKDCSSHLNDSGVLLATFLTDDEDFVGKGWIYPGCVNYKVSTMSDLARSHGFNFQMLDWYHPRQQWALFAKEGFDIARYRDGLVSWNKLMRSS